MGQILELPVKALRGHPCTSGHRHIAGIAVVQTDPAAVQGGKLRHLAFCPLRLIHIIFQHIPVLCHIAHHLASGRIHGQIVHIGTQVAVAVFHIDQHIFQSAVARISSHLIHGGQILPRKKNIRLRQCAVFFLLQVFV